jgi:hypothetical protein
MLRNLLAISVVAITVFGAGAAEARSDMQMTYAQGRWMAAAGRSDDGIPMCAMATGGTEGRSFHIKWFANNDGLIVQIFKDGWVVPMNANVPVEFQIDHAAVWSATAVGRGNSIFFRVLGSKISDFMNEIAYGATLKVAFPAGSEQPWSGSLDGSGGAAEAMLRCIKQIKGINPPTQPYSTQPVQPAQPTQPFTGVIDPSRRPAPDRRT